jgi:hypothetical protein
MDGNQTENQEFVDSEEYENNFLYENPLKD